jgi:myo-inositol catabolism protein IolC
MIAGHGAEHACGRIPPVTRQSAVVAQIRAGGFVGFAIGRSIWEEPIAGHNARRASEDETVDLIATRYLRFARAYCTAADPA